MGAQPLGPVELGFIEDLKQASIIKKIVGVDPRLKNGFIFCVCGDCDRFPESYRYQKNLIKSSGCGVRPHLISLNGGPLLIPEISPLNVDGESRVMKRQIADSLKLKGLDVVLAMLHAPCGAAGVAQLSIEETFSLYLRAVKDLQRAHPEITIVTQCHLHKPEEASTYSIDIDRLAQANFSRTATA